MLRLVVLLCAVMFVALLIAGEDRGQMRPGLASAVARGDEVIVLSRPTATSRPADPLPVVEVQPAPEIASAPAVVVPAVAEASPAAEAAPERVRRAEPVFTLSSLPGLGGDKVSVDEAVLAAASGDASSDDDGFYVVTASSVNVRLGPSTSDGVVGKLWGGEEVRILSSIDAEWVEVVIEGDGLSGYVASRFLRPAP